MLCFLPWEDLKVNKSHTCPTAKAIEQMCRDWTLAEMWRNLHLFPRIALSFFLSTRFTILLWEPILVFSIAEVKINTWNDHQDNVDLFPAVVLIRLLKIG